MSEEDRKYYFSAESRERNKEIKRFLMEWVIKQGLFKNHWFTILYKVTSVIYQVVECGVLEIKIFVQVNL